MLELPQRTGTGSEVAPQHDTMRLVSPRLFSFDIKMRF